MNILAIDPAAKTGYASSTGPHGVWLLVNQGEPQERRLLRLYAKLLEAARLWGTPDVIASEAASFGSINPNTAAMHNELRGIIKLVAAELRAEYREYHPTTIKAFATGSGRADKTQMMRACERILGIVPQDDNEADALWVLELAKQGPPKPPAKKVKRAKVIAARRAPKLF